MIRVLHIVGGMDRAGAESMIMNLYRKMDRSKIQFDFLYFKEKKCDFDEEINAMGGRIFRIPTRNPLSRFIKTKRFLDRHPEYTIVHSHTLFNTGTNLLAARWAAVPYRIAHSHNTRRQNNRGFVSKLYMEIAKFLIQKNSTHLFACGREASYFLFGNRPSTLLYNAVDITTFLEAAKTSHNYVYETFGIPKTFRVFLQIGRLQEVKNHSFSLSLMKALKDKGVEFRFLIIGRGELEEELTQKTRELDLEGEVIFTGVREDIPEIMAGADLLLMPSFFEGFPVVLVESQSIGLPALISDRISPEVDLGVGSIKMLSLEDSQAWIEYITKLERKHKKETDAEPLRQKGFDLNENAKKLSEFYLNLSTP